MANAEPAMRNVLALALTLACLLPRPGRAQKTWNEDDFRFFQEEIFSPFYAERRLPGDDHFEVVRRRAQPGRFSAKKVSGVFRIFVVGESVAMRYLAMDEEGARVRMSTVWARLLSGRPVEIVPAAVPSYDSARIRLLVDEVLEHEPDLVVVLTGNNEDADPGNVPSRLYLVQRPLRRWTWFKRFGGWLLKTFPPRLRTPEQVVETYESNLDAIAAKASKRGVPLVICALPRNLADASPSTNLPLWDRGFFESWNRWTNGDAAGAEPGLRRYAAEHPTDPMSRFYLGRVLMALGRRDDALAAFKAAAERSDSGVKPSMDEAAVRAAARGRAGLADLQSVFEAASQDGIPDSRFFDDAIHWHEALNPLVNVTIAEAARRLQPGLSWDDAALAAEKNSAGKEAARVDWTEAGRVALLNAVWAFNPVPERSDELSVEAFDRVRRWSPKRLDGLLSAEGRAKIRGDVAKSIWVGNKIERLDSLWPSVLDDLGEMYRRAGQARRAVEAFDEALRLDADRPLTRGRRALAELALGRRSAARSDAEAAAGEVQRYPELGWIARAAGVEKEGM
jgi:tetratricopeptide (TPR) repeat protein